MWKEHTKKFYRRIFDYFLQGLLYIAPLGLTVYFFVLILQFIGGFAQEYFDKWLPFHIPGLGVILMFALITIAGYFGHKLIFTPFKLLLEKLLSKAPLIESVYTSIRDLISAFVGKDKKFNQPVLVKVNKTAELEKIGFLTANDLSALKVKGKVAVYFPHSYAFSGELFIVPSELVTPLDITPAEAMKFIVSGGVTEINDNEPDKK
ncbi:MAG TPA: DUF502 domain-containing protein [Bacteroidales bacterium]|nr:DUF502 domain-containing protein [Bacteroidales bacterium]